MLELYQNENSLKKIATDLEKNKLIGSVVSC